MPAGAFLYVMLTYRRHRIRTRWPRRLAFVAALLLVLLAAARLYHAWQQAHLTPLTAPVQVA